MTQPVSEFIGCFMRHVLPPGFKRIRHDGLLATAHKRARLVTALAKPDNQAAMIKRQAFPMHPLLHALSGGDRRSVGESNRAVLAVLECPELIGVLFQGLETADPILRMRCADAIEKVTANRPELLLPFKKTILNRLSKLEQQEVRWHVAPMLARLPLTEAEEVTVVNVLLGYTNDRSSIVKTLSMQALADIALRSHRLLPGIKQHIEALSIIGTPAMKARGKKLLKSLAKESHG